MISWGLKLIWHFSMSPLWSRLPLHPLCHRSSLKVHLYYTIIIIRSFINFRLSFTEEWAISKSKKLSKQKVYPKNNKLECQCITITKVSQKKNRSPVRWNTTPRRIITVWVSTKIVAGISQSEIIKYKLVACIVCIIVEQSMLLLKDKVQRKWSLKVITTSSVILLTLTLYILTYAKYSYINLQKWCLWSEIFQVMISGVFRPIRELKKLVQPETREKAQLSINHFVQEPII